MIISLGIERTAQFTSKNLEATVIFVELRCLINQYRRLLREILHHVLFSTLGEKLSGFILYVLVRLSSYIYIIPT